jgi:hypothetical protein
MAKHALSQLRSVDLFPDFFCWKATFRAGFKKMMTEDEILELIQAMEYLDDLLPDEEIYQMVIEELLKRTGSSQVNNIQFLLEEMEKNKVPLSDGSLRERLGQMNKFQVLLERLDFHSSASSLTDKS